jgi:DhnA family fructose-bisphosphate aldolase class Ia
MEASMNVGRSIRMKSLFAADGRTVIAAIDHGGIAGPLAGIVRPAALLRECVLGAADAVLTTRGFARAAAGEWDGRTALILRLTGGFTVLGGSFEEQLISSPETALRYGASAAAVTVKFGDEREGESIRRASLAADACEQWGLPLLVEALVSGKGRRPDDPEGVKLVARAAQEIGAEIVKVRYTGAPDSFRAAVEGCPVPVVILGGEAERDPEELFSHIHGSLQAGGAGVAMGRNVFQHPHPRAMVEAMVGLVHQGWSVRQALAHL